MVILFLVFGGTSILSPDGSGRVAGEGAGCPLQQPVGHGWAAFVRSALFRVVSALARIPTSGTQRLPSLWPSWPLACFLSLKMSFRFLESVPVESCLVHS